MNWTPITIRLILLCVLVGLCLNQAVAQTPKPDKSKTTETEQAGGEIRLKLADGSFLVVDDAWESPQGIWYRRGGMSHLAPRDRVKSIERRSKEPAQPQAPASDDDYFDTVETATPAPQPKTAFYDKPVWIYLKGGARVEADSASESPAGAWYKRGSMEMFIDRVRIDRIELEDLEKVAKSDSKKERGWSTGNKRLDTLIRQNGSKYGVDPYLIFLVIEQESHFNSGAVSPKGARGLMQLMPGTAARFGVRRPHDPAQNISGGTRFLRQLLNKFNNRVDLVLASYNAGEGAVAKFGQRVPPYSETRNYVKKIGYRYKRVTARKPRPKASNAGTTAGSAGER